MMNRIKSRYSRGFTLVELLVVIGIIVILMGLIVPTINMILKKVKINQTLALVQGMSMSLEAYKNANGSYAPDRHPALAPEGQAGISSESLAYHLSGGSLVYVAGSSPSNYPWRHALYQDTSGNQNGRSSAPIYYEFKRKTLIDKNNNLAPEIVDPWGKRIVYNTGNDVNYSDSPGNPYNQNGGARHGKKTFDIFSAGPDSVYGTDDDIRTWGDSEPLPNDYNYDSFNPPNPEP